MESYGSAMHPATFVAGEDGEWRVDSVRGVLGAPLSFAPRLRVEQGVGVARIEARGWSLSGVAGHARYTTREEATRLSASSPPLARPEATRAALIPIKKSEAWWGLAQDVRRGIFEMRSRHVEDSFPYLPRIARRLYHARDLGQPFDFLTWFEYAPEHASAFEELVQMLRTREEWDFVEREVDVRLSR